MSGPPRRTVALPESGMFKRAGKIRLGITEQATSRAGTIFDRPKAVDYFVVKADDSGITSPEAADAFHQVYGDEPKVLDVLLPGHTPEDIFEGAHRLYGKGKLKRRCDGSMCDVRLEAGGWAEKPCVCQAERIPPVILKNGQQQRNEKHCTLSWTLQVILAKVSGIGVWTVTTTSQIARDDITSQLRLAQLMSGGSLAMMKAELWMREVEVTPDGRTKKVWVPSLRIDGYTPAQLMEGQGRAQITGGPHVELPQLPAPEDDVDDGEHPDSEALENDVVVNGGPVDGEALDAAIRRQLVNGLTEAHAARLHRDYGTTVKTATAALIAHHGEDARNLALLLDTLAANEDGEHVDEGDVEIVGGAS
jgi:hypothetical protein